MSKNISFIDGLEGILKYREIDINQLVELPYDAVSYLLILGELPGDQELAEIRYNRNALSPYFWVL